MFKYDRIWIIYAKLDELKKFWTIGIWFWNAISVVFLQLSSTKDELDRFH